MHEVAIFGAGGLGCMVHDILLQATRFRVAAFLDSNVKLHGSVVDGLPVAGGLEAVPGLKQRNVHHVIVAIGYNHTRISLAQTLQHAGMRLVSAVHPLATISPTARLGEHLIVGPRATVCVHAKIGPHCVLSAGSIVEHDNELGAGVFLHPAVRLAGTVRVEDGATLGIGASVIPGRRIGRWGCVEPGSIVIRDVPAEATVGGIPARPVPPSYRSRYTTAAAV